MADRGHTGIYTTNDLPGCPKGGPLLDTDKTDDLWGGEGDDEIRGLGGKDDIGGGDGNDVIYGGDGDDVELFDGKGADAIYGGDGNDYTESLPGHAQPRARCPAFPLSIRVSASARAQRRASGNNRPGIPL